MTPRRWWLTATTAIAVAAVLAWTLRPTTPEQPRSRQYLDFTACLLTGEQGLADTDATPTWTGLQQASLTTHAKVQYLAITGPQTIDNANTFVATLTQTHCNLILATGTTPIAAVNASAPTFPTTHFYIIRGKSSQPNVTTVDGTTAEQLTAAVAHLVTATVPT